MANVDAGSGGDDSLPGAGPDRRHSPVLNLARRGEATEVVGNGGIAVST
jgi:hypothetical protein